VKERFLVSKPTEPCLTCYGAGEVVTEQGPEVCPDCFGEGGALSRSAKLEWRLREMERAYSRSGRETEGDVLWLVHELRRCREALVQILARCQDADEADSLAQDVKYRANEALGLYEPR
jgi:DnaJ-class molecular chaperone